MKRRVIPETENRVLLLYAIRALQPVSEAQLLEYVVEHDLMNYFTMQLGLCEMEEQGYLNRTVRPVGGLLILSESGEEALQEFIGRVPQSRRELVDSTSEENRSLYRRQQLTPAEKRTLENGQICLRLRLFENERTLLDILYALPPGEQLHHVQKRWLAASGRVYQSLTSALMINPPQEKPVPPLPPNVTLQPCGDGDWLLTLMGSNELEPMVVILSLPDEGMACWCASRWPEHRDAIRDCIHTALHEAMED